MVFVCPPKDEAEKTTQIACKLKEVMQEVDKLLTVNVKPVCMPCCVPLANLPPCEPPVQNHKQKSADVFDPPQIMVCYKEMVKNGSNGHSGDADETVYRLKKSKSRELRASILYTGCNCEKRDGLQDDCPRTGCHGSPECLTQPPTCGPSEFSNGKHLGRKSKNGNGNGGRSVNGGNGEKKQKARYKCFPATLDSRPVPVCCTTCCTVAK